MYVYINIYIYLYIYLCMCIYIYICIYTRIYIHICIHIYIYIYIHILNMYIYVCTYICIYLCKYCRPLYHIHYNSTIKSHILLNHHIITQPSYYIYHSTYQDYTPCENYSQPIELLPTHENYPQSIKKQLNIQNLLSNYENYSS